MKILIKIAKLKNRRVFQIFDYCYFHAKKNFFDGFLENPRILYKTSNLGQNFYHKKIQIDFSNTMEI